MQSILLSSHRSDSIHIKHNDSYKRPRDCTEQREIDFQIVCREDVG